VTTTDEQALTRVRLNVAYDGTGFSGWSEQPGRRTVQGEIEQALVTLFRRLGDVPTVGPTPGSTPGARSSTSI
jgi:tRNA pseudouridine38-40 synthase